MKFTKRQMILGLGSVAAGSGALIGTGAFDVTAQRSATVDVSGDSAALLKLESADGTFVSEDGTTGEIGINFDATNSNSLNPSSITVLGPAFAVTNVNGTGSLFVEVATGTLGSAVEDLAFVYEPALNDGSSHNGVVTTDTSAYTTGGTLGYVDDRGTAAITDPQGSSTTSIPGVGTVNTKGYLEIQPGATLVVSAVVVTSTGTATDDTSTFTMEAFEDLASLTNSGTTNLAGSP